MSRGSAARGLARPEQATANAGAGGAPAGRLPRVVRTAVKRARRFVELELKSRLLERRIHHVTGPAAVDYGAEELLLVCVVRNGELHVRSFIEHHLELGVRHIVLLDNGSTDRTLELARSYELVTILRTEAPYRHYENAMKRYLAHRFSRNRWNLCVDIDERFTYPFADQLDLAGFLRYLNQRRYTAVVAQMLDLFPDRRLCELGDATPDAYLTSHVLYDLSAIRTTMYRYGKPPNPEIAMHWGGVRKALFGTDNGLTKAPLVFVDDAVDLFVHFHHVENARLADVSAVLLHYPFAGAFAAKVGEAVRSGRYGRITGREYASYRKALETHPDLPLRLPTARRYTGLGPLLDEGFLVVSPEFRRWVENADPHRSDTAQQWT